MTVECVVLASLLAVLVATKVALLLADGRQQLRPADSRRPSHRQPVA